MSNVSSLPQAGNIIGVVLPLVGGTGLSNPTAHSLMVTEGALTFNLLAPGTTGQLLQTTSGADPAWTTATYPGTSTANQLLYSSATNVIGGLASANNGTLVTSNSGVPSILVGPGTTGNILQSNAAAAPSFSSATYPVSTVVNQILYSSSTNVVSGLASGNSGVLVTSSAGVPSIVGPMTNGMVVIGSTGATPVAAALVGGAGINIANGAGSITVSVSGAGFTWQDQAVNTTAAGQNGYMSTAAINMTLPAGPSNGSTIAFIADTTSALTITAAGGQFIRLGNAVSAAAGTAVSTKRGDALELVYRGSTLTWLSKASIGTWTVT